MCFCHLNEGKLCQPGLYCSAKKETVAELLQQGCQTHFRSGAYIFDRIWVQLTQTWSRIPEKVCERGSQCAESLPSPTFLSIGAGSEPPSGQNGPASVRRNDNTKILYSVLVCVVKSHLSLALVSAEQKCCRVQSMELSHRTDFLYCSVVDRGV